MNFNTRELADAAGLKVYDTALPLDWYDDVHKMTGYWPQSYGFVWCYDKAKTWGEPYPLTEAATILLAFYNTLIKHRTVEIEREERLKRIAEVYPLAATEARMAGKINE